MALAKILLLPFIFNGKTIKSEQQTNLTVSSARRIYLQRDYKIAAKAKEMVTEGAASGENRLYKDSCAI